jgi:hypothetical protein
MKTEEFKKRYGEVLYQRKLKESREWNEAHQEQVKQHKKNFNGVHPEYIKEYNRKGGVQYLKNLKYQREGLSGKRHHIRCTHGSKWRPYKNIIAPLSQIHHEWIPGTADYRGVALVDADQHMYGFVDVIEVLEGKITVLREDKIKNEY